LAKNPTTTSVQVDAMIEAKFNRWFKKVVRHSVSLIFNILYNMAFKLTGFKNMCRLK